MKKDTLLANFKEREIKNDLNEIKLKILKKP
jgi:hypothetical protein